MPASKRQHEGGQLRDSSIELGEPLEPAVQDVDLGVDLHQEKIYFVTWASEAEDALDAFCQLRRQSFGQLASRDTQETRETPGRHLGDTEKTQVCAGRPGCPKDTRLGLASRDTSKAS